MFAQKTFCRDIFLTHNLGCAQAFNSSDLPELRGWDLSPPALSHWRLFAYHSWDSSYHSVRSVAQSEDGSPNEFKAFDRFWKRIVGVLWQFISKS
eukprot:COSAG04_NODE_1970_length_5110_cov_7.302734_3_plen_95_part_00